jgi:hypothetical protein
MPHTLDFFFYIGSTCTYLAVPQLHASLNVDVYDRRDLPINEWWDWRMVAFAYQ